MNKRNIRLIIAYDGTRYQGWQRLKGNKNTIQGKIEDVLTKMTGESIEIIASGRTDAGVHAKCQVANFHTFSKKSVMHIKEYMNTYLPEDIIVMDVKVVKEKFHSRYNASEKTYLYRIWIKDYPPLFERKYVHAIHKPLNIEKMKHAAASLIGEHDFQGFCSRKMKKSTIREIKNIDISITGDELRVAITADGFLYNMVRIIVGTLIDIGLGKLDIPVIQDMLVSKTRSLGGEKAPAKGLCLVNVQYN